MADKPISGFNANVHFRVPSDFMARVHRVARSRGMTASNFMRSAIIDALHRSMGQDATPDRDNTGRI